MTGARKSRWWLLLRNSVLVAASLVLLVSLSIAIFIGSGAADSFARRAVVRRLEQMTGGDVQLQRFHMDWRNLTADLDGLTIHGLEPPNTPPLFHVEHLRVVFRVVSLFRTKIVLEEVALKGVAVRVRRDPSGASNLPAPKGLAPPGTPLTARLFALAIRKIRMEDGVIDYNDVHLPLSADGEFAITLDESAPAGQPIYAGQLSWKHLTLAANHYVPFASDLALKFTLERDSFTIEQLTWKLPHSQLDAHAELGSFARGNWTFRYRGRFDLADAREIFHQPMAPSGIWETVGEGNYLQGRIHLSGHYTAHDLSLRYPWFHSGEINSKGTYQADNNGVELPDFQAQTLGGNVTGHLKLLFAGMQFRADTQFQEVSLARTLTAVNHAKFPIARLNWTARMNGQALLIWRGNFQHLEIAGKGMWTPDKKQRANEIPVTGQFEYRYAGDKRELLLTSAEIRTPLSHIAASGALRSRDSAMDVSAEFLDLEPWNDFIATIRGYAPGAVPAAERVAGRLLWRGHITGRFDAPTFIGHAKGDQIRYGDLAWNSLEGDVTYSPTRLTVARGQVQWGHTLANLDFSLALSDWSFLPSSVWTLDASVVRSPTNELQAWLGTQYPVSGLLTGQFHGGGTRAAPAISGLFDVVEGDFWGLSFDRFRGQLGFQSNEVRISNAELRAFAPQRNGALSPAVITGNLRYRMKDADVAFDLTAAGIPLESIRRIQTQRLPIGGKLNFKINGQGPLRTPSATGSLRVIDLSVGKEVLGSFEAKLDSDGKRVRLNVDSAMSAGRIQGAVELGLGGELPLLGDISLTGIDLDPFIQAALRVGGLTGHSMVDGHFQVSGKLTHPETIAVEANLTHLVFEYETVKLENAGPVRLNYRGDELRIEEATLRGIDTDFKIAGFARFAGPRAVKLDLSGTINLRLARGFFPGLNAGGPAKINAAVEGSLDHPRVNGRVHVENASARYEDFPTGLAHIAGDLIFDSTRLLFEKVTADSGGGQLEFSGQVQYGESPIHYEVTARTAGVRIRYPEGLSSQASGTVRLSGTPQASALSGRVTVIRVVAGQGFDFGPMLASAKEPGSALTATSPFLRNLQLDIEADSAPNAAIEWPGAHFEAESALRVRGTWGHPVLLGYIHLLAGEITFRGSRYQLSRGDINFSRAFSLDPDINMEATASIRQYEITLNFSGRASHLILTYRSDPPLPSSDIITLLAVGRTGEESQHRTSTSSGALGGGASTLLSEAISSQLGGRLERLFGITRLRVDPMLGGSVAGQNAAARVSVEEQITRDLTITYISSAASTQQQVIQVEYNVNRNVSILALRDENGTFGLDIKIKKRFK